MGKLTMILTYILLVVVLVAYAVVVMHGSISIHFVPVHPVPPHH